MHVLNTAEGHAASTQFSCNWLVAVSGTTREVMEWKNISEGALAGLPSCPHFSRFEVGGMTTA